MNGAVLFEAAENAEEYLAARKRSEHSVLRLVDESTAIYDGFEVMRLTLELAATPEALEEVCAADRDISEGDHLAADDVTDLLARRRAEEVADE